MRHFVVNCLNLCSYLLISFKLKVRLVCKALSLFMPQVRELTEKKKLIELIIIMNKLWDSLPGCMPLDGFPLPGDQPVLVLGCQFVNSMLKHGLVRPDKKKCYHKSMDQKTK